MVERHLALAQHLAGLVDEADDLERLADVTLNVVVPEPGPPASPRKTLTISTGGLERPFWRTDGCSRERRCTTARSLFALRS